VTGKRKDSPFVLAFVERFKSERWPCRVKRASVIELEKRQGKS